MSEHTSDEPNLTATAIDAFRQYLGIEGDISLSSNLMTELGVDSLLLITILLDIADRLQVDLFSVEFDLGSMDSLADVVSLIHRVRHCDR